MNHDVDCMYLMKVYFGGRTVPSGSPPRAVSSLTLLHRPWLVEDGRDGVEVSGMYGGNV